MAEHILAKIVACKRREIKTAMGRRPEASLRADDPGMANRRSFHDRLATPNPCGLNIIAEIKRASPSKGPIRPNLDPAALAYEYEKGGAAALSVLTDQRFFQGSANDLKIARQASTLPVLRKDFVISAYQIYESTAIGADAVLLIATILSGQQLKDYLALCTELKLGALVEIHSENEHAKATQAGAELIGINNRNLKTFQTDITTSITLASRLSETQVGVAESAIRTAKDIAAIKKAGIYNFLIGESLVRATSPRNFLQSLARHLGAQKPIRPARQGGHR